MIATWMFLCLLVHVILFWRCAIGRVQQRTNSDLQGPRFTDEPPGEVFFLNTTGTVVRCNSIGQPVPEVTWVSRNGQPVLPISGIREIRRDGSLVFSSFRADEYQRDIHDTVYKCTATNAVGTIGSRDVKVKGVLYEPYIIHVYDQNVIRDTTAVLTCYIPSHVTNYVYVSSWVIDDNYTISSQNKISRNKYILFPEGSLHIHRVTSEDGQQSFRCFTKNRLTGETKGSYNTAHLVVLEPNEGISPTITDSKPQVTANVGETAVLPCAGQGQPPPTYSWFHVKNSEWVLMTSQSRVQQVEGTLLLEGVQVEDEGQYHCVTNNSQGKSVVETMLTVIAPLKASVEPHSLVMLTGGIATLTCVVSGHPVDSIVWMKNFRSVIFDGRIHFRSRNVLHIRAVTRADQGMYQCFVYSHGNNVQAAAQLIVGDVPPELHNGFAETTLDAGASLSLQCIVSGHPLPEVT